MTGGMVVFQLKASSGPTNHDWDAGNPKSIFM